jgi:hypothetical protein
VDTRIGKCGKPSMMHPPKQQERAWMEIKKREGKINKTQPSNA